AKMDAFCGRLRSTRRSGRSEDGKNCGGTSGTARKDATNSRGVTAIVSHRPRIAVVRKARYHRNILPGPAFCAAWGGLRITTPNSGANTTATNHDTMSAM